MLISSRLIPIRSIFWLVNVSCAPNKQMVHDICSHSINNGRHCRGMATEEAEGIDLTCRERHCHDNDDEGGEHDGIDGPPEGIPIHRACAQFKQQSCYDEASADDEALGHSPRFVPHFKTQNYYFRSVKQKKKQSIFLFLTEEGESQNRCPSDSPFAVLLV